MGKRKNNHYLTRAIVRAFFSNNSSYEVWEFNPSYTPYVRVKSESKLFSKRNAWNQELEELIGSVENRVVPVIKELSLPGPLRGLIGGVYNGVEPLDKLISGESLKVLERYLTAQLILLSIARKGRDQNAELFAEKVLQLIEDSAECIFFHEAWRVYLDPEEAANTPLVLTDNLLTLWAIFEKYESDARSINAYAPLTENMFLFWGDLDDLHIFAQRNPSIDFINRERIRESGKLCRFASTSESYLKRLAGDWNSIHARDSAGLRIELV